MNETEVLLSRLAIEQLSKLAPNVGRAMIQAISRLTLFPESAPLFLLEGYEMHRQVIVQGFRAVYRYFPEQNQVRIYCILPTRRQLPAVEFLTYQLF